MAREKQSMPQSQAGLMRTFDDNDNDSNALRFSPKLVVGGIVALIILELLMQWTFAARLGL